ncbi:MAG: ankyrin repeat domain-containing protein [Myxococcota bacterium]
MLPRSRLVLALVALAVLAPASIVAAVGLVAARDAHLADAIASGEIDRAREMVAFGGDPEWDTLATLPDPSIAWLLEIGAVADVDAAAVELVDAGRTKAVGLCLDRGARSEGLVLRAAIAGRAETLALLLDRGAAGREAALVEAARKQRSDAGLLLLSLGVSPDPLGEEDPLWYAARNADVSLVRAMLATPIHEDRRQRALCAATSGEPMSGERLPLAGALRETLDALVAGKARVRGKSPLPLVCAAWNGNRETAAYLLDRGARVDDCDEKRGTALATAVFRGDAEMVRLLLERGASPAKACPPETKSAWEMARESDIRALLGRE